ncbi:phage tail protein [Pseudomonas gingeri NCPPB 3146 = LMG 5327]|uniref:Phage tail protein n=2 Tax=Pseudomonas gingeri TaxID=117681 RepID=A0A7Y8CB85_9PSED|nr:phage tail protein [Pseudomonas gingeri]NWC12464.1 phage tail protein [Pseudomonas gingeri]PNQ89219.1 phage tail protein [Pseudomonas gingeri NCPPB 3146 = LMG 5327]
MVNQNSIFGGMLTNVGAAKKTNCDALGVPWQPSHMLIGDASGTDPVPSPEQTKLINQVYRAPLNQLYVSPTDANVLVAELVLPPNVGGWWIRELALEDVDGVFSAVANCAPSYKPLLVQGSGRNQVVRMHIVTSNTANIQLKIDPAVVLATREYVETSIIAALNKQDFKHSVQVATTAPIALSGLQTVDGVALSAGARVLVKDQAAGKDNGIYLVASGAWPRAADADTSIEVTPGLFVHVEQGAAGGDSIWQLITDAPITLGTTPLAFEMVAGRTGVTAGTYTKLTVDKNGRVIAGTSPATLAGYGITDAYSKGEVDSKVAQASSLPVGALIAFPRDAVSPGFLELDGSVQSSAAYPDLFAYLGTTFNKGGEGAGSFRLPESRGEFLRGWDHGRGVDAGRVIGSYQADDLKSHDHTVNNTGTVGSDPTLWVYGDPGSFPLTPPGTRTNATGGSETRPRNLAVMWCIKAWNAPINQGSIDVAALAALAAQATEARQGTAKVASATQMSAGSDDSTIVTPKKLRLGFSVSLATNGYLVFPSWLGGLVIQWGYYASSLDDLTALVSFQLAFPAQCLNVIAVGDGGQSGGGAFVGVGVQKVSKEQFRLNGYGTSMSTVGYHWLALGY